MDLPAADPAAIPDPEVHPPLRSGPRAVSSLVMTSASAPSANGARAASDDPGARPDPGTSLGAAAPGTLDLPALVARATDGDVRAFEELVRAYQSRVYGFALAFAASPDDARDLSQEALIKVYRSIGSFRFQSSFTTWLYAIVKNVFLDAHKSRATRERALESPIDDAAQHLAVAALAEEGLLREDERQALYRALRRVPAAYRAVVVMFDVQGLSYDEIARVLSVPVGTVKSRLKRGRDALRAEIFRQRGSER